MWCCELNAPLGLPAFPSCPPSRRALNQRGLCAQSQVRLRPVSARKKDDDPGSEIVGLLNKLEKRRRKAAQAVEDGPDSDDSTTLLEQVNEDRDSETVVVSKKNTTRKSKVKVPETSDEEVDEKVVVKSRRGTRVRVPEASDEEVERGTKAKVLVTSNEEAEEEDEEEEDVKVEEKVVVKPKRGAEVIVPETTDEDEVEVEEKVLVKSKRVLKPVDEAGLVKSKAGAVVQEISVPKAQVTEVGRCFQQHCVWIPVGDRQIVLETGSIGRQASGAVTISDGETIIYTTVCVAPDASEPSDFAPLHVYYHERFSAAGRTSGAFNKREGKPRDHEVLISRMIDRPLRSMIPKGYVHEIQVLSWVLSYDGSHLPEPLAITAAGAAMALSEVPLLKPIAGVRVGFVRGKYVLNPTAGQKSVSKLDMVMAGTSDGILMIEGDCDFLTEEQLLNAIEFGQHAVSSICKELESFGQKYGQSKDHEKIQLPDSQLQDQIKSIVGDELLQALHINGKTSRLAALKKLERKVCSKFLDGLTASSGRCRTQDANSWLEDDEGQVDQGEVHIRPSKSSVLFGSTDVKFAFKELTSATLRTMIATEKLRSDGRGISDLRPIKCSCGLLPRAHGSALFTRGETQVLFLLLQVFQLISCLQALVGAILGGDSMGQRVDGITELDEVKRFYVQYVFPNSCVGEVGRPGSASRREIGHGKLIEKALEPIFPPHFSYTVRVESTITESNGSSSMASVSGAYLALADAGVPLKCPVAGVAMGLILDPKQYGGRGGPVILTDILGSEDAFGDMDLKVAGGKDGITAFQMDLKVQGITLSILKRALSKAKTARIQVLKEMTNCSPAPAAEISRHVPHMDVLKIGRDKITMVIGSGGKTVKQIIDDSGVETVNVASDGSVQIIGTDRQKIDMAKEKIRNITSDPVVGAIYRNCLVTSLTSFGCFVEIIPGRDGLCHISELTTHRLSRPDDYVTVGERLDVKLIEINSRGQLKLSHRAVLEDDRAAKQQPKPRMNRLWRS